MDDFQQMSDEYFSFQQTSKTRSYRCHKCDKQFFVEYDQGTWKVICVNEKCKAVNVVEMR